MPTYERHSYGSDDGSIVNASSEPLGFFGKTPVAQYTDVGAASTYISHGQSTATASTYGLNSEAAVTSLIRQVSTITQALKAYGMVT